MSAASASIRLEDVWKTYRVGGEDVHALAGVSIAFPQGSFWAIMGPSGSGKSTLLNLLGCLDRPSRGVCFIQNQPTAGIDDDALSEVRLRHLGFIFQSFNLIAQLSVRENIELPLFYLGWDAERSRRRAEELAAQVGLEQRLEHRPSELSGGQQQRVAIARALANDPAIILADEPTGNLDTATGIQIMDLLRELNRRGKTVIMVTHEPEIAAYAHHRLHIRDGRIDRIESTDG
ncbi:ABC transporter ATP-binding protein [Geoalkalibacter sp.]|uniref:ABC transporter ATP-binding protein n=1 Tax=Geoalkalibacter sp. TaxID=3041440 RepID=UPI00272ED1E8|nr:ABC transporter ATP-binding protein [Geoalkalibacter sp.]